MEPELGLNECIAVNLQSLPFICVTFNRYTVANFFECCACYLCSSVRKRVREIELGCNNQTLHDGGGNN